VKLALDHHFSTAIAVQLRRRGHDVVAAVERGWNEELDELLLAHCVEDHRALLTNDLDDFPRIAGEWALEGRRHHGLILASDAKMRRTAAHIGRYVRTLDALLAANPADDALADRIIWLLPLGADR
jgi:hypothetical protein